MTPQLESIRLCAEFVGVELESAPIFGNILGVKSNGPIAKEYNPLTNAEQNEELRFKLRNHTELVMIDSEMHVNSDELGIEMAWITETIEQERQAVIDAVCEVMRRMKG